MLSLSSGLLRVHGPLWRLTTIDESDCNQCDSGTVRLNLRPGIVFDDIGDAIVFTTVSPPVWLRL